MDRIAPARADKARSHPCHPNQSRSPPLRLLPLRSRTLARRRLPLLVPHQAVTSSSLASVASRMQFGTASSSTATGNRGKDLPLVDCPQCEVRLIKIRGKQEETYGQLFFKCPNNIRGNPRTCGFIRSEEQNETYLHDLERKAALEARSVGDGNGDLRVQCAEMKQDIGLMKQQLQMVLGEIGDLKMQRTEMKGEKKGVNVVIAGCVGVVIGMLVRAVMN